MKTKTQISASLMFDLIDFELHSKVEFRKIRETVRQPSELLRISTSRLQDAFECYLDIMVNDES